MLEHKFIPGPVRSPTSCFKKKAWEKIIKDGKILYTAFCGDTSECYGCHGEFTLDFDPNKIVNFKEIRAPNEEDYINTGLNIITSEEYEKKTLKEYVESKKQWYYFHDFICDEDRICIFQLN